MALQIMYPGMVNSPETTITNNISESDTIIYVLDPARVPEPPNLMTLGTGTNAETVKVTEINGSAITVERGFQGVAKSWPAGTVIARNFTEYDYNALKENIEDLEATKETPQGAQEKADAALNSAKQYTDQEVGEVSQALAAHQAEDVTQGDTPHGMVYEEGTWTPNLIGGGGTSNHTYTQQRGNYVRIGNKVTVSFEIRLSAKDGGITGGLRISGLPFAVKPPQQGASFGRWANLELSSGRTQLTGLTEGSVIYLYQNGSNLDQLAVPSTGLKDNTLIQGSATYII